MVAARRTLVAIVVLVVSGCGDAESDGPPPVQPVAPVAPVAPEPAPTVEPTSPSSLTEQAPPAEEAAPEHELHIFDVAVRFGRLEADGAMPASTVRRVVRRHESEIAECFRRSSAPPEGRVELHFEIAARGSVTDAALDPSVGGPTAAGCVTAAAERWTFPGQDAPTRVTQPLVVSPQ